MPRRKTQTNSASPTTVSRRDFLRYSAGAICTISLTPWLGCESNLVEPLVFGRELPFITPLSSFFTRIGAEVSIPNWQQPQIERGNWQLAIRGNVNTPRTIRFADLEAENAAGRSLTILKTMRCVIDSNEIGGLVGNALWTGVPLLPLLEATGIGAGVKRLRVYGTDGFTNNFTIEKLNEGAIPPLLVTHMNGFALPVQFGGPVRLLIHDSFGYKNVKWIEALEATTDDAPFGTYQDAGFVDDGVMRVSSRLTDPLASAEISAGEYLLQGFAVSGSAAIAAVDVSIDGGPWENAEIVPLDEILAAEPEAGDALQVSDGWEYPFPAVWAKWRLRWNATAGQHEILLRARDTSGAEQPVVDTEITDGVNAIAVVPVKVV